MPGLKKIKSAIAPKVVDKVKKQKVLKAGKSGKLKKVKIMMKLPESEKLITMAKKISFGKTVKTAKNADGILKKKKAKKSGLKKFAGIKKLDPEFFDFLKENDQKLLDFNLYVSDDSDVDAKEDERKKVKPTKKKPSKEVEDSDDSDVESEIEDDESDEDKYHKPSGELEVASDESDFENEEDGDEMTTYGAQKITLYLLRNWQLELEKKNVSIDVIRRVIQAFNSALASISGDDDDGKGATAFKVDGATAFNGVVQLCILFLQPAILRYLGLTTKSSTPLHKTKKWVKVRGCLRYYLTDLIRFLEHVSSPHILSVLLKHLHQMAGMVGSFSTLGKTILKRLIIHWSTGDETVRVLAFLCILKITRNQQVCMLQHVLKAMYLSYIRNSKFVSPNTLPGINFMRRSLVEMFALDLNVSYQHAFLYIRQLAIHLRNAVILKKKDSFKAVYNWQYVNSIRLWVDLLGATANKPQLKPLIYPLVTITLGVIRLIPTAQYFPLRFHCISALNTLAKETQTYIPVLPFIFEVLRSNTFNRKHTAVSMRPPQFTCILRLNKSQLSENGFRDEVVEQVCGLTLEYLTHESSSLAYSDLVVPTVIFLKAYLKDCRNSNHSRKLKQLLDKIQENARFIDQERNKITFGLNDTAQVQAWETQIRNKGTPLSLYYGSWLKTHEIKKRRQAAQTDNINDDYDVPTIKRNKKSKSTQNNGEVELFPSDSEDDGLPGLPVDDDDADDENKTSHKTKNGNDKKQKKKANKKPKPTASNARAAQEDDEENDDDGVDIVKDLDLNDW